MGIIRAIKQTSSDLADNVVRKIINARIESYGTIQSLKIDRELKELDIVLNLNGETDHVHVICRNYSFHAIEEKIYVMVESYSTDRPWLNAILNDFATQKFFPLDHPRANMIPAYLGCDVVQDFPNPTK